LTQGAQQNPDAKDSAAFNNNFPIGPFTSGTNSLTLIDPGTNVFAEFVDADFHETTDDINGQKWLTAEIAMDTQKISDNLDIFTYPAGQQTETLNEDGDRKFTGTVTYGKQTLLLNDRRNLDVALDHSTFGAWYYTATWNGTETDLNGANPRIENHYTEIVYHPFYGADSGATALAPTASDTFTGAAHAQFSQHLENGNYNYISEFRSGTAELTIGAVATTGDLALTFPNAYNIDFNGISIDGSGAISTAYLPIITANNNTTGISLKTADLYSGDLELEGQFYGTSGTASEAAGIFRLGFRGDSEVMGSFGVKN
jgi:hypothetical protein